MSDENEVGTGEAPIGGAVVERVAERADLEPSAIVDALLAVNAELLGRHSEFERTADYVTVEGTRAYRVGTDDWADLLADFEFDETMATAVRAAHTEQAGLLFATAVDADDRFADDEAGVVIGIDTAEQF